MAVKKRKALPAAAAPAVEAAPPEPTYAEWEGGLTRRERYLYQVLDMMLKGQWLSGASDTVLAKQWECSPANVRQIAAEANRVIRQRLRETPEAKAEARAHILQLFEVIRAKAMAKGDAPSLRVALDALRAYGFYLGIEPAKRVDVTVPEDPFAGWTVEEKLAYSRDGRQPRRAARALAQGETEH